MIDPKEKNRLARRDSQRKKGRYGMKVNPAGKAWALLLKNILRKKNV